MSREAVASTLMGFTWFANPKGPKIEKIQSRLKIQVEIFNLARKFEISLEIFNLDLQNSQRRIGSGGRHAWNFQSRSKISIPEGDLEFFQSLVP